MIKKAAFISALGISCFQITRIASFRPSCAFSVPTSPCAFLKKNKSSRKKMAAASENALAVDAKNESVVSVRFRASKFACTAPLPMPPPEKTIDEFFLSKEHRNMLFSAGAEIREIDNPPKELMDLFWNESETGRIECQMPPRDETAVTRIVEVTNPSMPFLGVKLLSVVTVGTQLLLGLDGNGQIKANNSLGLPEFQFTLLDSFFIAEGPRPLVWLFQKITGRQESKDFSEKKSGQGNRIGTKGFTRIRTEMTEDGRVKFCTKARLESILRIPRLMVRLLPTSVENMEKQGSATLHNAIEKDISPALNRFGNAYLDWVSGEDFRI
mmetsp:Transcript_28482/g.40810  ORF Transcript_28482/g.40810 Transcript_28482/m.40810 type:complete len:326 (+) Transcript_28482:136-1113(+)